jgi:hypothetical protein
MAKDFRATMEALGTKIGSGQMAAELGCSRQAVKQARLAEGNPGRRPAPPGWEQAAKKLAEQQAAHFEKLAASLA